MARRTMSCDPFGIILIKVLSPVGTVFSRRIGSRWYFISLLCSWPLIYAANIVWVDNRRIIVHTWIILVGAHVSCFDLGTICPCEYLISLFVINIWFMLTILFVLTFSALIYIYLVHIHLVWTICPCVGPSWENLHLIHFSLFCWDNLSICSKLRIWLIDWLIDLNKRPWQIRQTQSTLLRFYHTRGSGSICLLSVCVSFDQQT